MVQFKISPSPRIRISRTQYVSLRGSNNAGYVIRLKSDFMLSLQRSEVAYEFSILSLEIFLTLENPIQIELFQRLDNDP